MIVTGDAKIFAAFVKARGEIAATVRKDAKGNYGKYATLAALTEATLEPMAQNGLAIVQEASVDEAGATIETWVVHEAGGMMQFAPLTLPVEKRSAQAVGSAITYARRYALAAICGIAPDDDDGQAATDEPGKPQARPQNYPVRNTTRAPAPPRTAPPVQPDVDGDVLFAADGGRSASERNLEPPTDEEHALLTSWEGQPVRVWYDWAESVGVNRHEAKSSLNKIVDAHGGWADGKHALAIMLAYIRKQRSKVATPQPA